jgi:hypothetical protein
VNDEEIKLRFDYMQRDIGKLESAVTVLTATLQAAKINGRQWPSFITLLLIVIPMYALVIDLIVRGMK